jgi:hypothetical protein
MLLGTAVKKTAIAFILISALLLLSAEIIEMAHANPFYSIYAPVEPVPGTIPPSISINSPQNNTVYAQSEIAVSLFVKNAELAGWNSSITRVAYFLDTLPELEGYPVHTSFYPDRSGEVPELTTAFNLSSLSMGKHNLTVTADVVVLRDTPPQYFLLHSSSTIFFTTTVQPAPTPTPEPFPSLKPQFELKVMQAYAYGSSCLFTYDLTNSLGTSSSNKTIIEVYSVELFINGNLLGSKGQGFFVGDNLDSETLLAFTSHIPDANSGISSINYNGSRLRSDVLQLSHLLNSQDLSGTAVLRVERLGFIIVDGESVVDNLSSGELVEEITLERHEDGFIYDVLPEPTPTMPNMGPTSPPSYPDFYLDIVYWVILLSVVIVVGIVLWIYFRKHQKDRSP